MSLSGRSPLFSVIIPVFNRAALLEQALESVCRQEFRDFEVIVVDDGSTDDLSPVVRQFGNLATFLHQDNSGPGASRNRGAAAARGQYLAFMDSDDLWFPWTLSTFAQLIDDHRGPAILSGRLVTFAKEAELDVVDREPLRAEVFADFVASSGSRHMAGGCTLAVQRMEFLRTGGFVTDRINAEDHDLILRMGTAPGFVKVIKPVTLGYRTQIPKLTAEFGKTIAGVRFIVDREHGDVYPGGAIRSRARRTIISEHVRPVVVECLRRGTIRTAWQLYRSTAYWHVQLGRWRFLLGVPAKAATYSAARRFRSLAPFAAKVPVQ